MNKSKEIKTKNPRTTELVNFLNEAKTYDGAEEERLNGFIKKAKKLPRIFDKIAATSKRTLELLSENDLPESENTTHLFNCIFDYRGCSYDAFGDLYYSLSGTLKYLQYVEKELKRSQAKSEQADSETVLGDQVNKALSKPAESEDV